MQWYGVDILDVGTPHLSWRRLHSLIEQLPRESRYAAVSGGDQTRWGHLEHLVATVVDLLQIGNWMFASAHSKSRVNEPKMIERPGVLDGERIGSGRLSKAEMREQLDRWRAGTGEV